MSEMKQLPTVVPAIFKYLNTNTTYAVLRNAEGLPYHNKSRDIDILIPRRQYEAAKKDLAKIITNSDFKIISFFESERICTFVCGKVDATTVDLVQFDFFFHTLALPYPLQIADYFLIICAVWGRYALVLKPGFNYNEINRILK